MKTYHPTNNLINQQTSTPSPLLMRQSRAWSQRNNAIPDTVHETLRAPGRPLDGETRQAMETHFGHDFSQVRIHADRLAAQSADAVDAHAYTVGHHIAFAAGQFAPHTTGGRKLLAHELAHTIQQGHAASALSLSIDAPNSAQERAAQSAEKGTGRHYTAIGFRSTPRSQREKEETTASGSRAAGRRSAGNEARPS